MLQKQPRTRMERLCEGGLILKHGPEQEELESFVGGNCRNMKNHLVSFTMQ